MPGWPQTARVQLNYSNITSKSQGGIMTPDSTEIVKAAKVTACQKSAK